MTPNDQTATQEQTRISGVTSGGPTESTLRILLVDDNPHDRALISRELCKEYDNVNFIEVIDRVQFQEALRLAEFDVVITDFQLQWTDGLDVLQSVKAAFPTCPVVMFTATGSEEIAVEAMKSGLDEYIIKNVKHLVRLRSAVRSVLQHAVLHERASRLETRLASLLRNLKVGVFRSSPDGLLFDVNESLAQIVGRDQASELNGDSLGNFFVDQELFRQKWHVLLTTGRCGEFEALLHRGKDQTVWTSLALIVTHSTKDEKTIEGLVEDISERKQNEEAIRKNEAELAHIGRLTIMGEMVAGIAHEIGQPLGAISNFSNVCLRALENADSPDLEILRKSTRRISEQSIRAGEIIRGLRQFVSRQQTPRKRIPIHATLKDAVRLMAYELRQAKVDIVYEFADNDPAIIGDRVQIQQVVINLLQNAVESMEPSNPTDRFVTISTRLVDGEIEVEIRDRGTGLPECDPDTLFNAFVTTKPNGMGMGLAITSSLISGHGGKLWYHPTDDVGAAFRFALPAAMESEQDA